MASTQVAEAGLWSQKNSSGQKTFGLFQSDGESGKDKIEESFLPIRR